MFPSQVLARDAPVGRRGHRHGCESRHPATADLVADQATGPAGIAGGLTTYETLVAT